MLRALLSPSAEVKSATLGFVKLPSMDSKITSSTTTSPFREMSGTTSNLHSPSDDHHLSRLVSAPATHDTAHYTCTFSGGNLAAVEVSSAPIKGAGRIREKLAEYSGDGAPWPLCAQILDPVRASVVCQGPAHMVEVAGWFLKAESQGIWLPICRVKNKFTLEKKELVGGYRDLMLCGIVEGVGGLRLIGEIQIHDKVLHDLKLLMHKLYRICRAKSADVV